MQLQAMGGGGIIRKILKTEPAHLGGMTSGRTHVNQSQVNMPGATEVAGNQSMNGRPSRNQQPGQGDLVQIQLLKQAKTSVSQPCPNQP